MSKTNQTRQISTKKLRSVFNDLADMICNGQDRVNLSLRGNTFEISLQGATINITVNEHSRKGGAAL